MSNLENVLHKLQAHSVRVKKEKCQFLQSSVQYLGHMIDSEGIHARNTKLKAIIEAPKPKNLQELRSLLGLLNYYGCFMLNLSSLLHILNQNGKEENSIA